MKIICNVREFGEMVRMCEHEKCGTCILKHSCDRGGVESLVYEATPVLEVERDEDVLHRR